MARFATPVEAQREGVLRWMQTANLSLIESLSALGQAMTAPAAATPSLKTAPPEATGSTVCAPDLGTYLNPLIHARLWIPLRKPACTVVSSCWGPRNSMPPYADSNPL